MNDIPHEDENLNLFKTIRQDMQQDERNLDWYIIRNIVLVMNMEDMNR